jgi:hypothetical protein
MKIAMEYHTSMRSFDEGAFCCDGDEEGWQGLLKGGLVFGLAKVGKLWSTEQFLFSHIENKLMFQESQPCDSQQLKLGKRFEIYLQASFRVIDKAIFHKEAKALHLDLCLKKKRSPDMGLRACHVRRIPRGWELLLCRTPPQRRLLAILECTKSSKSSGGCIWLC